MHIDTPIYMESNFPITIADLYKWAKFLGIEDSIIKIPENKDFFTAEYDAINNSVVIFSKGE